LNFPFRDFATIYLRGVAQVMHQKNAITGLLFILGIGLNSQVMLVGGMLGALIGIITAKLLRFDEPSISSGLYGFNGTLVGIAIFFFHIPTITSSLLLIIGAALSSIIMRFTLIRISRLPPLTAPFVISAWVTLGLASVLGVNSSISPEHALLERDLFAVFRGVGQVMFQGYWVTGALFLLGLFVHSPNAASWAFIGSCVSLLFARTFGFPEDLISLGIYGFNASLVGIALSSRYGKEVVPILLGILLSVLFTKAFELTIVPALTAPFVLAFWVVIGLIRINSQSEKDI